MKILATTVKGTEYIVRDEISIVFPVAHIMQTSQKNVAFEVETPLDDLKKLTTPDDLQLLIATGEKRGNKTYRDILYAISSGKTAINEVVESISELRNINNEFNITITTTKESRITPTRLTTEVAKAIERVTDLKFNDEHRDSLDFRVYVDSEYFYISIRIFQLPHFHRNYKVESAQAALRPSLAAVMIRSIDSDLSGKKLLDPMCGGGTILCEAHQSSIEIFGGDILEENIKISLKNLSTLGFTKKPHFHTENASETAWKENTFDAIISNPPWGKQIDLASTYKPSQIINECVRVAKPDAYFRFLTTDKEFINSFKDILSKTHKVYEIQIGHLGQKPKILCANPK